MRHSETNSRAVEETFAQYSSDVKVMSLRELKGEAFHTGLELVIACDDCLHLLLLSITIEWSIATKKEIGDHTHSPDIHRFAMPRYMINLVKRPGHPGDTHSS